MKRNLWYLLMLVGIMSVFTACSDDKDEPNIPIEKELAGTYKGNLDIVMNGAPLVNGLPKNISISKAGVSAIDLELKDFNFMGKNLGDIIISDCRMLKYRDHYTFSGDQALTLPTIGECKVVADGTLIGNDITVNLDIAVTQLGQTVKVTFAGAKLLGNESSEAKITNFTFETSNEANSIVSVQPIINDETITFVVLEDATVEQIKALVPSITISPKATLVPAIGTAVDFNSPVVYTVVAENGITKTYTVEISGKAIAYDFEAWEQKKTMFGQPFEDPQGWSTSNGGSIIMGQAVVEKEQEFHSGQVGVSIKTIDSGGGEGNVIPKITTGSLFLGDFKLNMLDALSSTLFGVMYNKKPISLKGYYKYTSGQKFYRCADPTNDKGIAVLEPGTVDECSINVILYEVASDKEAPLNGHNVYTSDDKVVAIAKLADGSPKENWTEFNLQLDYKKPFDLVNKKYRFSIICSSSKYGDQFSGAPGSTLIVDDFELVTE